MRLWKLLAALWASGRLDDRGREPRRAPSVDCLNEVGELEGRGSRRAHYQTLSEQASVAEVIHVAPGTRQRESLRTRSQIVRLSTVIVDYLLEHEWFTLLPGYRRTNSRKASREQVPADQGVHAEEDTSRTVVASDSRWSVVISPEDGSNWDSK